MLESFWLQVKDTSTQTGLNKKEMLLAQMLGLLEEKQASGLLSLSSTLCDFLLSLEPHQAHQGPLHPGNTSEGGESQQHRAPHTAPGTAPSPDVLRWSLFSGSHQPSQELSLGQATGIWIPLVGAAEPLT